MYLLPLILPLNAFIVCALFSRYFGREVASLLNVSLIFLLFLSSLFIFYEVGLAQTVVNIKLLDWLVMSSFTTRFGLLYDSLTALMLVVVSGISFLVHLYSLGYMKHDPFIPRFLSYLSLFTFFMLILITSDNFVQMFFGWEGVGLCSYLLISFWFTRIAANKAALKAMIVNRISDVFFIYGILLILIYFKTSEYLIVFLFVETIPLENLSFLGLEMRFIDLICFFLMIGGIGKSAQLGLHTWLPDAMEGPTPVSSLLHAATMVTAGVFLILRCSFLFELSSFNLFLIMILGGLTSLFAAIVGFFQYDLKKVIAYSTCSQLGYMFFSCGLSNYHIAIFHLFNHAFFKALLFLSAGSVIHALVDEQDMRRMGNLVNFLPFTYFCVVIGSLAIMGFPFLTGFYSKDLLLELTFVRFIIDSNFIYFLGITAAFFTAIYSVKLLLFVFFNQVNSSRVFNFAYESYLEMAIPMFILALFSVFVGFIFSDLIMGWGTFFWNNAIRSSLANYVYIDSHFVHPLVKNLPFILSLFGFLAGVVIVESFLLFKSSHRLMGAYFFHSNLKKNNSAFPLILRSVSSFFFPALHFNSFYNKLFDILYTKSYSISNKTVDKGFFEFFGPFGFYKGFRTLSLIVKTYPPSVIFFNIGFMFLAITFFLTYLFFSMYLPLFLVFYKGLIGFAVFALIFSQN